MPVKINSSGGGSVTLSSGGIATDVIATFPATTGNAVVDTAVQTLTNKTLTSPTITGAVVSSMASSVLTLGTAQASTSGTAIDFTGIPSWVRRVTVMLSGVSTNGSSSLLLRIGSGSVVTSGYVSSASFCGSSQGVGASTAGFVIALTTLGQAFSGILTVNLLNPASFLYSEAGVVADGANFSVMGGGFVTLAGALDRIRITTINGTDLFDAGSINIMWE